jgi:ATP-dependent DNA helicase RecQ
VFGVGADLDDAGWRGVFRQLVALGLAQVDHEAHGALKLTAASRPVLRGEERVEMLGRCGKKRRAERAAQADLSPADADLLQRLKGWRSSEARAQGVPAYVISHDSTLAEIARRQPQDLAALARIGGLGAKRLERYGAALLELLGREGAGG